MKIYTKKPPHLLIRINIKKQGATSEFITLSETTQQKVFEFIESLIKKQNISPFLKGNVTNVEIREWIDGKNSKSISLSFRGLEPKQVLDLITAKIQAK